MWSLPGKGCRRGGDPTAMRLSGVVRKESEGTGVKTRSLDEDSDISIPTQHCNGGLSRLIQVGNLPFSYFIMSLVASRETKQVSDRFERRFGRVEETVSLYRGPSDPKQKKLSRYMQRKRGTEGLRDHLVIELLGSEGAFRIGSWVLPRAVKGLLFGWQGNFVGKKHEYGGKGNGRVT
ncbi:hypothetical protein CK203_004393 [Vitis vinifera]|uniref:Uncharacterized protein n=1 Tax=Vitis vinifera TaxID=29760 RepID=A0A438K9G4_VITVI|nr:hypothetical protein CK203_004393 [Vitis vinifera]